MRKLVIALGCLGATAAACTGLIGVKDIYPASEDDGGGTWEGGGIDARAGGDSSSGADAGGDAGVTSEAGDATCIANVAADPLNCGRCGHDCLGGQCEAGVCLPNALVTTGDPRYLAIDDGSFYWDDDVLDKVFRLPKSGAGSPITLATLPPQSSCNQLKLDSTSVYLTLDTTDGGTGAGAIAKCPLDGGALQIVTTAPQNLPRALAVDSSGVYWVDQGVDPPAIMFQAGLATASQITSGETGSSVELALAGGLLFWTSDNSGGALKRCALPSCSDAGTTVLTTGSSGIGDLAIGAQRIFWSDAVIPGSVYQMLFDGGALDKFTSAGALPHTIVFDSSYVYWLNAGPRNTSTGDYDQGSLQHCPLTNGVADCGSSGPTTLVQNQLYVRSLVQDAQALYWITSTTAGSSIMRLAKP
jgi:hypothetical protein